MSAPSLFHLASKAVAKGIHEETIPIGYVLDAKCSNPVFAELLYLDPCGIPNLEGLSISEMDFRHVTTTLFTSILPSLSKFNLTSLSLGDLALAALLFPFENGSVEDSVSISEFSDTEVVDIVELLKSAANEKTRRSLRHLGLRGEQEFGEGWELEVSKLFPSLVSIDINSKIPSDSFLADFCLAFANLRHLDISSTNPQYLMGLENLKNLEKLVMCDVRVVDEHQYAVLSKLGNLRHLDVSSIKNSGNPRYRSPVVATMLIAGVRMEKLEFLDCSRTLMGDEELKQFVSSHPMLKMVVAIGINFLRQAPPGIHLIHHATPSSTIECVKYSISMRKHLATYECLLKIFVELRNHINNIRALEGATIRNYHMLMLEVMRDPRAREQSKLLAFKCVSEVSRSDTIHLFTSRENVLRMMFAAWKNSGRLKRSTISLLYSLLEDIAGSRTSGQRISTDLLNVVLSVIVDLIEEDPSKFCITYRVLEAIGETLSWDQSLEVSPEIVRKFFELAERMVAREKYGSVRAILFFVCVHLKRAVHSRSDLVTSGVAGRLCKALEGLKRNETFAILWALSKVLRSLMVS